MIEFEIEKIEEELSMAVKRGKHKNQQQRQTINFKQFFSVSLLPSFPISVDEQRRPEKKMAQCASVQCRLLTHSFRSS